MTTSEAGRAIFLFIEALLSILRFYYMILDYVARKKSIGILTGNP